MSARNLYYGIGAGIEPMSFEELFGSDRILDIRLDEQTGYSDNDDIDTFTNFAPQNDVTQNQTSFVYYRNNSINTYAACELVQSSFRIQGTSFSTLDSTKVLVSNTIFKCDTLGSGSNAFFAFNTSNGISIASRIKSDSDFIEFLFQTNDGSTNTIFQYDVPSGEQNKWIDISVICDQINKKIKIFFAGSLVLEDNINEGDIPLNSLRPFGVNQAQNDSWNNTMCVRNAIAILTREVTEKEIKQLNQFHKDRFLI